MPVRLKRAVAAAAVVVVALSAAPLAAGDSIAVADLPQVTHIHGIAIDPADPARLFLATHHGFFVVAPDGMVTRLSPVQDFMGFTPHPADPSVLYASGHPAGGGNLGFIASTDGGVSWTQISPGLQGPVDFHQMVISPSDPNVVYGNYGGIQASRDGGRSWTMAGAAPDGLIDLAASAIAADRLYAATKAGLWRSDDAGKTWQAAGFAPDIVSMVETGRAGKLFAFVVGRGLFVAGEDDLAEWTALGNELGGRALLHFAVDPADLARFVAVDQDSLVLTSLDGGRSWAAFG
ncbi:MAG: WD40/YVTN/BNR-like repeat-containing protein, partial [Dongiaceae bacterium]